MEIQVERNNLDNMLLYSQNIAEKKSTMPILSHGLLVCEDNNLSILVTDLEVYCKVSIAAQVVKTGRCCVPIRNLASIVKDLSSNEILIRLNENQSLEISSASAIFRLNTLPSEDFPVFQAGKGSKSLKIQSTTLKTLLNLSLFSMSSDETRIVLNSVLFNLSPKGGFHVVSTDGHRLSYIDVLSIDSSLESGALNSRQYIIPKKGAIELARLCEHIGEATIGIFESEQSLSFQFEHMLLSTRLIDGEYPDYQKVLEPKHTLMKYTLDRELFSAALRRTSLLSSEKSRAIQFTFSSDKIDLYCTSETLGDARETIVPEAIDGFSGERVVITFNSRYLLEPLNAISSEKIHFCVKDRDTQAVIYPSGSEHYRAVIMPMRI